MERSCRRRLRDRGPLAGVGEHRVHDRRMAGSGHPPRLVGERGIDLCRDIAGVGRLRQAVGFGEPEQNLALDVAAQHHRARLGENFGCERAGEQRLAGARQPAHRQQDRRRRRQQFAGKREIVARALLGARALGAVRPPRRGDLGADRRAQRQEQRQRGERIEILHPPRLAEIAIEHDIGRWRQPALDQVHQQEGEIVEHVAGGDLGIEFDGVEQHRRAVEQNDIAEMQIAVAARDPPGALARDSSARTRANAPRVASVNAFTAWGGKSSGAARSSASFWAMISASASINPAFATAGAAACARATARPSASASAPSIRPACGQMVERLRLVEAPHLHRPFHRRRPRRRWRARRLSRA